MATGAAGDGLLFRGAYEGCISGHDTGIQRRPYHRNCSCALHKLRGDCSHAWRNTKVSYPIRRSWSESCLSLMGSGHSSPSSSPAPAPGEPARRSLALCHEDDQEEGVVSCKL